MQRQHLTEVWNASVFISLREVSGKAESGEWATTLGGHIHPSIGCATPEECFKSQMPISKPKENG